MPMAVDELPTQATRSPSLNGNATFGATVGSSAASRSDSIRAHSGAVNHNRQTWLNVLSRPLSHCGIIPNLLATSAANRANDSATPLVPDIEWREQNERPPQSLGSSELGR